LLYYSPFSSREINDRKHAFVERVGAECRALDAAFFLEIVNYHDELDEKSIEFARMKPESVTRSVADFSDARYGVDVFKVSMPVNMAFLEDPGNNGKAFAYTRVQAKAHFNALSSIARKPFLFLSEGVSNATFGEGLHLAAEARTKFSGVLCGRATWKDGVAIYVKSGVAALEHWLADEGARNIKRVNAQLSAAVPWFTFYEVQSPAQGRV
jgi:tagatose 1,6-diphosphate aldolase